jgi:SAM-dependent MidA family methyltransferase
VIVVPLPNQRMTFAEFMERCLYDPEHGYYTVKSGVFGRSGDFYTSAYTHPIFAEILAEGFAAFLRRFPGQHALDFVELGPGEGLLAARILARLRQADPELADRVRYFPVEVHEGTLPERISGLVFSNEFFDALPVHRVRVRKSRLQELYVEVAEDGLREVEGPLSDPRIARYLESGFRELREGWDYEASLSLVDWIEKLNQRIDRAVVVTIDYGFQWDEYQAFARAAGTVLSYYRHQAVTDPLLRPGEQDITAHVNFDALLQVTARLGWVSEPICTQREFLVRWGLHERLLAGEQTGRRLDGDRLGELLRLKELLIPGGISDTMKVLVQRVRV